MKRVLLCLFPIFLLCYCSEPKQTIDLMRESIATGIKNDTILGNVYFGMTEREVFQALGIKKGEFYKINIDKIDSWKFEVEPSYYNDSLYSLSFSATEWNNKYTKLQIDKIYDAFSLKYNSPDITTKKENNTHYHWYIGNLEIELCHSKSKYGESIRTSYTNLDRYLKHFDRQTHVVEFGEYGNMSIYTRDYYNNIYLPRKKGRIGDSI